MRVKITENPQVDPEIIGFVYIFVIIGLILEIISELDPGIS